MSCCAPLVTEPQQRRRVRLSDPPTPQQAFCWAGWCRVLDDHAPRCPRAPTALQRAAAELHGKLELARRER